MSAPTLAKLLESFFRQRLVTQRNASPATVESYRDALRLLVRFVSKQVGRQPCDLAVSDFDRDVVLEFLDQLERQRGNGVRTRNARLTAIRSFFRHVAASDPAALAISQRVLSIPTKRTTSTAPRYLTAPDLTALLNAPNRQTYQGRRDHAFLLFLLRTGARVSETIGIDAADLRLEPPYQVLLRGKGRKERVVPLAADLAHTLRALCRARGLTSQVCSPNGQWGPGMECLGPTPICQPNTGACGLPPVTCISEDPTGGYWARASASVGQTSYSGGTPTPGEYTLNRIWGSNEVYAYNYGRMTMFREGNHVFMRFMRWARETTAGSNLVQLSITFLLEPGANGAITLTEMCVGSNPSSFNVRYEAGPGRFVLRYQNREEVWGPPPS